MAQSRITFFQYVFIGLRTCQLGDLTFFLVYIQRGIIHQFQDIVFLLQWRCHDKLAESVPVFGSIFGSNQFRIELVITGHIIYQCLCTTFRQSGIVGITAFRWRITVNSYTAKCSLVIIAYTVNGSTYFGQLCCVTAILRINDSLVDREIKEGTSFDGTVLHGFCLWGDIRNGRLYLQGWNVQTGD